MNKLKFLIFFIFLTSCIQGNNQQVQIVDKNGKPAKIVKIVPQFNEEQMAKQKEAFGNKENFAQQVNKFRQNYNDYNQDDVQNINTIPERQNKNVSIDSIDAESNILIEKSSMYPNDIFEDRITNYNYNSSQMQNNNQQDTQNGFSSQKKTTQVLNNNSNDNLLYRNKGNKTPQIIDNSDNNNQIIEENNALGKNPKTFNNTDNKRNNIKKQTSASVLNSKNIKNYYIQIGVYGERKNAETMYNKYKNISTGFIDEYKVNNILKYKVVLGPFSNKKTAESSLNKVIKTGHYDVYITEKK